MIIINRNVMFLPVFSSVFRLKLQLHKLINQNKFYNANNK